MQLSQLIAALDQCRVMGSPEGVEISGLTADSRRAGPGVLFAALRGSASDGHDYAPAAMEAGAPVLLVERPVDGAACQIVVDDTRRAFAVLAAEFHGWPSRQMVMAGVTGTNGKTTVTYLCEALLARKGPSGIIGTVQTRWPGVAMPSNMTTPDPVDLQALLARMVGAGVMGVAMEVSSHALDQHRATGCAFDVGVFTNLTRDHLDYHGDMESYFDAKRRLFNQVLAESRALGKSPAAVICCDDPRGPALADEVRALGIPVITYGLRPGADLEGKNPVFDLNGGRITAVWQRGSMELRTQLVGLYNLQNLLGAAAMGLALGMDPAEIKAGLETLPGVPGRMERVPGPRGCPAVFVDYAHTPDALDNALQVLRPLCRGRLICVFGAGGDRDRGKRPLMGQAAAKLADAVVVTSDNPRGEDPQSIIEMIEPGLLQSGARKAGDLQGTGCIYVSEPDRAKAISMAVRGAGSEDVVLIAGKGHEDYQDIMGKKSKFDDRQHAAAALAAAPEKAHA